MVSMACSGCVSIASVDFALIDFVVIGFAMTDFVRTDFAMTDFATTGSGEGDWMGRFRKGRFFSGDVSESTDDVFALLNAARLAAAARVDEEMRRRFPGGVNPRLRVLLRLSTGELVATACVAIGTGISKAVFPKVALVIGGVVNFAGIGWGHETILSMLKQQPV
jgi:hypothetical protein